MLDLTTSRYPIKQPGAALRPLNQEALWMRISLQACAAKTAHAR